jgi:hypothetical protein
MALLAFQRDLPHVLPNGEIFCAPLEALGDDQMQTYGCTRDPYEHKTTDYASAIRAFAYWSSIWSRAPHLLSSDPPPTVSVTTAAVAKEARDIAALYLSPDRKNPLGVTVQQTLQFPTTMRHLDFDPPDGATRGRLNLDSGSVFRTPLGLPGFCPIAGATIPGAPTGLKLTVAGRTALDGVSTKDTEVVHLSVDAANQAGLCSDSACAGGSSKALDLPLVLGTADFWVVDTIAEQVVVGVSAPSSASSVAPMLPTIVQFIGP